MRFFLVVFLLFPGAFCGEPYDEITKYLTEYVQTGQHRNELDDAVTVLLSLPNKTYQDQQICATCKYVIDGVIDFRRSGVQRSDMLKLVKYLCNTFGRYGSLMCNSLADMEIDAILYMIDQRKNLTSDRVCSIYLQNRQCVDPDEYDWTVKIPDVPKNITENLPSCCSRTKPFKILHITDVHVDPAYKPGSDADCGKPLCCESGTGNTSETTAGYWGDYHVCDMPWHSVTNLFEHTKNQHKDIKYIYFTGDIIAHAWETSKASNMKTISDLMSQFRSYFPKIRTFPVLGNHEAHPSDYYAPLNVGLEKISTQWLFDLVADEWSAWLPESTKNTIKKGGYYTVVVEKGFRIVALNSNVCYTYNVWLIEDDVDPYGQLQWLADTLAEAEGNGEVVHILSHIPPGGIECWKIWVKNFNKIVRRFSNTIVAQFNGHTHMDELRIFLDEEKTKAVNVAYNGGSFTTFVGYNPNYRVYDVSPETYYIMDYEEWIYNLTSANIDSGNNPPDWYPLYSFREAYGLKSADLTDLYDLTQRMQNEEGERTLLKQYRRFLVRDSEVKLKEPCDNKCLDNLMCSIVSVDFSDALKCV